MAVRKLTFGCKAGWSGNFIMNRSVSWISVRSAATIKNSVINIMVREYLCSIFGRRMIVLWKKETFGKIITGRVGGEKRNRRRQNRRKVKSRFRFKTRVQSSFRYISCLASSSRVLFCRVLDVVRVWIRTLEARVWGVETVLEAVVDKWARIGVTPGSWCSATPGSTAAATSDQFEETLVFH